MRKRLKKTVDQFITVSPLLAQYMNQQTMQPVTYIPPFKPEHHSQATTPKHGHFLFAGNFGMHKGIYLLIEEFAIAHQQNPSLHLTIAGTGSNEREIHALVAKHKLTKHITFTGWQDNLDELYQTHFAVIVPSIVMESFGLIVSEAMSFQRPAIVSNRGSLPWLVDHNESGLIFDPLQRGDLADKMLSLAANPMLAVKLGIKANEKLSHLIDNDAALQQILNLYATAINPVSTAAATP
jgi:glycosyltransferase involved in cell wall biosynthesis